MYFEFSILLITSCGLLANSFNEIDIGYNSAQQDYECPSMCVCDLSMDLNRANCSGQHLIGANISMSSYVEVLDLSYNDITTIDNQCLSHLKHLLTLVLNDNSLDSIDLDAFAGLKKLRTVILSRNRLESIDNRIFEQNSQIFNVNLAENKFMNLPNEPLIISQSLQILDLHKCKMANLPVRVFEELPNLRSIDLSDNLLIVLSLSPFMPNAKLKLLNIEGNPLRCDAYIEMTLDSLRRKRIKVFFRDCPKSKAAMFERMIASETTTVASTKMPDSEFDVRPIDLIGVWKMNRTELCRQQPTEEKEVRLDIPTRPSWMQFVKLNVAFYAGLGIGTVFGMLIVCCMSVIVSKYFTSPKNAVHENENRMNRRNRRNRSQPVPLPEHTDVVRLNSQIARRPTNSFLSLFFERPLRHRYYRQLNRSATNLVRRLSQSRLFLNSTRAENANYRNNYSRTNTQDSSETQTQAIDVESNSDCDDAIADTNVSRLASVTLLRRASMPSMSSDNNVGAISIHLSGSPYEEMRSFASETNVLFDRAETPPPPYSEVVAESGTTT